MSNNLLSALGIVSQQLGSSALNCISLQNEQSSCPDIGFTEEQQAINNKTKDDMVIEGTCEIIED